MWKPITKHYKVALVWGVVCLLTFDTATACRFLGRRRACRCQCVVTVCEPTCGQPVYSGCGTGEVIKGDDYQPTPGVVDSMKPLPEEPMSPADTAPMVDDMQPQPMQAVPVQPMDDVPAAPKVEPMTEQPMEEPKAPAEAPPKAAVDDLFGDAPKPAEVPAEKPAAPAEAPKAAVDDLFGDKPVEQPPAKPNQPAPAKAPVDDLFGDAPKPAAPPANQPAAPPAKAAVDDLFGEPAAPPAKPAQPAPKAADPVDDLFGGEKPAAPAKTPPAKGPAKPVDDPFGAKVESKDELLVMRKWVDNTGGFTVHGRLVEILDGKVRLLKDNGKTCTVPMPRLSPADAQYVQMIVAKLGTGTLVQLASR